VTKKQVSLLRRFVPLALLSIALAGLLSAPLNVLLADNTLTGHNGNGRCSP
jgi:hypothetical protein